MGKPRLNRGIIVSTAIQIADEEDLAAVTLRGIAARLGVHVTSLYNHVETKEAVLVEMVKALIAEARLPTGELTWQDWIRRFAGAMRALARKHPGAFEAFHYGPAQGERAAEAFESAFAAFRAAGFDSIATYNAVKATVVAVLGFVLEDTAPVRSRVQQTDLSELPIERFPRIHELSRIASRTDTFSYVVDTLIEGIGAIQRRRPAAEHARAAPPARGPAPRSSADARNARTTR